MLSQSQVSDASTSPHTLAAWPLAVVATFLLLITALTAQFVHVTWFEHGKSPVPVTATAPVERTAMK